ncbi:MAG TPA: RcnB family protein [Methylobacter sp.]|jgi:Ni/Co efflux regulator RcnB
MPHDPLKINRTLTLVIVGMLSASPALADKHSGGGHDKADKHERREKQSHDQDRNNRSFQQEDRGDFREQRYFDDRHRAVIRDYYVEQFNTGRCPPGLAKKHNGCMPPGQAKQWQIGNPLPRNVVYYDLPPAIVMQLGPPQPGYRYARVGSDILLMAIGTGLVVDAIMDLSGR